MDVRGFDQWYRAEHPRLIGALFVLSGDADVASDATDEAFARALARWPEISAMASPSAWTYRVALNVLRRTLRRRHLEGRLLLGGDRSSPDDAPAPPEVWRAMASLPKRQRTAIVMRFLADLPEADIAVAMGVRRGTVSSTLALARKRLAVSLQGYDTEEVSHG